PVSVAITDAGGHLQAFGRSDGAAFLTVDIAIDKAWTASSFGQPTHVWNRIVQDPHMAPLTSRPRLVTVGGGCPLLADGRLIGGIGVSGGTYEQDRDLAEHALNRLGFEQS
ncbi:heme-binding protein, partial [Bombella sp. TMW 2.2559]